MTIPTDDPVWLAIRDDARHEAEHEPLLASLLHMTILNHQTMERALAFHLASKLSCGSLWQPIVVMELFCDAYESTSAIQQAIRADLMAVKDRDPACTSYFLPFLYFKGFHALQSYRVAHWLWEHERRALALALQSQMAAVFNVDIHPAARLGQGLLLDHATGIVIGETAVVGDNVSMLHAVTLGGTGKETGDRHPKIGEGVLIGAGAKILGNVKIGVGAKIGAGSVVLEDVPPHTTVAGVPARVVGRPNVAAPALVMDQRLREKKSAGGKDEK